MTAIHAMLWPIAARFVEYVTSVPDGLVSVTGAATLSEGGVRFAATSGEAELWRFEGRVRFTAHSGMLDLLIADPWIRRTSTGLEISVLDPDDESDSAANAGRIVIATGPPFDAARTTFPVLTVDGSDLFFARYPEGHSLDPLMLVAE